MLKSPAKIISLSEIFCLERERERERERELLKYCPTSSSHRLTDGELSLAQCFPNFCFQHRHTNIQMLWNLPRGLFWICVNKFPAKVATIFTYAIGRKNIYIRMLMLVPEYSCQHWPFRISESAPRH